MSSLYQRPVLILFATLVTFLLAAAAAAAPELSNPGTIDWGLQEIRQNDYNFVAFGPTGAGKTTVITYMTASGLDDVLKEKGGKAGAHTKSQTRQVRHIKSNYFYTEDKSEKYAFQFFDTPGHGAQDEKNFTKDSTLMAQTVNQLLEKTHTLNGVILVLKMERFRADLEDALKDYIKMFKVFDLDKKAFMVVITHSLQYNAAVKKAYTDNIFELFKDHVLEENVRHVNFCMIQELQPAFAKLYTEAATRELTELRRHLTTSFKDAYNIRHWVDRQFGLDKKIDEMFPAKDAVDDSFRTTRSPSRKK